MRGKGLSEGDKLLLEADLIDSVGKVAICLVLVSEDGEAAIKAAAQAKGFKVCTGKVGSMDVERLMAAVDTAARREGVIGTGVANSHALYHACLDCISGLLRGQVALGELLRTTAVKFSVVVGPLEKELEARWIAVAMFGKIGAPIKSHEHEAVGLGVSHI